MQKHMLMIIALLTIHGVLHATIHFGSRDAGFVVEAGIFGLGDASLSEGTLVVNVDNGLTSSGASCSHMKFDIPNSLSRSVVELNGNIAFGTNITLGTGQKLTLDGGTVYESVSVFSHASAPAIIEGVGNFDQNILVSSPCTLVMRWNGLLNVDIDLQSSSGVSQLVLERNLLFAPHHGVRSSYGDHPLVTCNGYTVSMGGSGMLDTWLNDSLTWEAAHIDLTGPFTLDNAVYTFNDSDAVINGNGNRWSFVNNGQLYAHGVSVYCNNIVFAGVNSVTFYSDTDEESGAFIFRDVTLGSYTEDGIRRSLHVAGDLVSEESDIFDGYSSWASATITLQTDITQGGGWSFFSDSTIEGNNFHLNLEGAELFVDAGVTLKLRNIVLDSVNSNSISGTGTINMSGVTIIVNRPSGDVDWSIGPRIIVDGPVTVITGNRILSVNDTSEINTMTLFYDSLGTLATDRVIGFAGSGRVVSIDKEISEEEGGGFTPQDLVFTANASLERTEFLYPSLAGMTSRVVTFAKVAVGEEPAGGELLFDGKGRSFICRHVAPDLLGEGEFAAVIIVGDGADATEVTLKNITIEGFDATTVAYQGPGDALYFGDNTRVILHQDWTGDLTLDDTFLFGSGIAATNEIITLDLNGNRINLGSSGALELQGASGSELHIMNGRISNLSESKIFSSAGNTIVFKDMILELSNTFFVNFPSVRFEGHCTITGLSGTIFAFNNPEATVTIGSGARVTFTDGMKYLHNNDASTNFVFEDATAQLELIGAVFSHADTPTPLLLTKGVVIIDHKVRMNAGGSGGIWFGDGEDVNNNLTLEIRPGATITVESGLVTYAQVPVTP